ncbi:MAG: hypothetical protein HYT80_04490 [Euryarchaeota archaeon]|nr:hypothetical protein [Euryarchaeota archaeon]
MTAVPPPSRRWFVFALTASLAGCVTEAPAPPAADDVGATTQPVPPKTTSDAPAAAGPLSDFEEALEGTWRRYHVKNKGYSSEYSYYEYVAFNADRTACRWKYGEESSSSSTDRVFESSDYPDWRIAGQLSGGGESYRVVVDGRGLDYVFDFLEDIVYPAGFETLVFGRTTDGKSCVYRGGASY